MDYPTSVLDGSPVARLSQGYAGFLKVEASEQWTYPGDGFVSYNNYTPGSPRLEILDHESELVLNSSSFNDFSTSGLQQDIPELVEEDLGTDSDGANDTLPQLLPQLLEEELTTTEAPAPPLAAAAAAAQPLAGLLGYHAAYPAFGDVLSPLSAHGAAQVQQGGFVLFNPVTGVVLPYNPPAAAADIGLGPQPFPAPGAAAAAAAAAAVGMAPPLASAFLTPGAPIMGYRPAGAAHMPGMQPIHASHGLPRSVQPVPSGSSTLRPYPRREVKKGVKPSGGPALRKKEQFCDSMALADAGCMKEPVWNVGHLMVHGAPMPPDNINCKYMGNIHGKDKFRILAAGLRRVVTAAHLAAGPEAVAQLLAKDYDWDADNWLGEWLLDRGVTSVLAPEEQVAMIPMPLDKEGRPKARRVKEELLGAAGLDPSTWAIVLPDDSILWPDRHLSAQQRREAAIKEARAAALPGAAAAAAAAGVGAQVARPKRHHGGPQATGSKRRRRNA